MHEKLSVAALWPSNRRLSSGIHVSEPHAGQQVRTFLPFATARVYFLTLFCYSPDVALLVSGKLSKLVLLYRVFSSSYMETTGERVAVDILVATLLLTVLASLFFVCKSIVAAVL